MFFTIIYTTRILLVKQLQYNINTEKSNAPSHQLSLSLHNRYSAPNNHHQFLKEVAAAPGCSSLDSRDKHTTIIWQKDQAAHYTLKLNLGPCKLTDENYGSREWIYFTQTAG